MWSARRWANVCTSTSTNMTFVFKGADPAALSATLHKRYNEKEKLRPPSSFLHGVLRYYRCPRGRKCTSSVAVTRPLGPPPWATEECRPVRCLEKAEEAGMASDWRPCRPLRILGSYRTRYRR